MNIEGEKINLRAIEINDLELLHKWANNPEIQYLIGGWHFPTNMEDQKKWFSNLSVNSIHQRFIIETKSNEVIGTANIVDIDWKNKNAFHGMMLGDKDIRGKGYGLDTVITLMRYAFDELGLNRLDGSMISYNEASLKLYVEKCGWKKEGVQRKWYFRKGKFYDKIIVGITSDDYKKINH